MTDNEFKVAVDSLPQDQIDDAMVEFDICGGSNEDWNLMSNEEKLNYLILFAI